MSARNDKRNGEDWESTPLPSTPCRGAMEEQLERLKEQLLTPVLSSVTNAALVHELRWVANEAAALAWLTTCPALVLPILLEEKIRAALQRWERQQRLWHGNSPLPAANAAQAAASVVPRPTPTMLAA
jgi:hypothetical protein